VLTLVGAFAAAAAQTPPSSSPPDLQIGGSIGADLFERSGSTGMVFVVVRGNQVFFRGYGETAPNSLLVPTDQSIVRLCSLTKIFTTDLLVKLAADKIVQLDDPLQKFAPPHTIVPTRIAAGRSAPGRLASGLVSSGHSEPITLEELATHTSGLPRELGNGPRGTAHFTFPDYPTRWRWLPNQRLQFAPGTAALYSNIAYDLLGDALASAAHKPLATLLFERTLAPLKMYQTTLYPSAAQCDRLLKSAYDEGACTSTEETGGSSGLYSTAADIEVWLRYLLGTGAPRITAQDPAAQTDRITLASLKGEKGLDHAGIPTSIGLGWLRLLPADNPSTIIEKTGGGAGYTTYIAISPARHTAIFLAATDGSADTHFNLFKGANNALLSLAGLPPLPPEPPQPVRKAARKHRRPAHR
jgi:serine-type D-Ala-D-Ala carboxypeptidase/endopeptidase